MVDISLVHGSQSFKTTSTKVNVFAMRADGTDRRDFPNKHLTQVKGTYRSVPASLGGYKSHGTWNHARYELMEGRVIMLMASTTFHGSPYSNGCILLYLREDAPMITVGVVNRYNADATYQEVPAFQGNADILTLDELKGYNIKLTRNFINNYFDEEEIEELLNVTELSRGTRRPELLEIKTQEGGVKKVAVVQENVRRIRIRKKQI